MTIAAAAKTGISTKTEGSIANRKKLKVKSGKL
jgi:hypothetical protein